MEAPVSQSVRARNMGGNREKDGKKNRNIYPDKYACKRSLFVKNIGKQKVRDRVKPFRPTPQTPRRAPSTDHLRLLQRCGDTDRAANDPLCGGAHLPRATYWLCADAFCSRPTSHSYLSLSPHPPLPTRPSARTPRPDTSPKLTHAHTLYLFSLSHTRELEDALSRCRHLVEFRP